MKFFFSAILMLFSIFSFAQLNLTLKSNVSFNGSGNDIWGYVAPDGSEYAVVGTTIGTRVYSLADVTNPEELIFIPGSNSTWRDMKQWGEYAYVTTDSGNDGLLIIDMSGAPENIEFNFIKPVVLDGETEIALDRCHNIYIDEKGIIMLAGCQGRGVEFFDPKDNPTNPAYLGSIVSPYSHDVYAKGDTLYASEIYDHLAMYDISDLDNIQLLGTRETSSDFTHNAWADPTHNYVFTTDERPEGFVDAYDCSDPQNIELLDKFMPPGMAGTGTIPHNTHYYNGYIVTSWYTSGVIITDVHRPENMVQVAAYDTYDGPDGGFSGCWGVSPYLPSGVVIACDINSGLYVFEADYVRACYLEGKVTDIATNASISNATVKIIDGDYDEERTAANGEYKTGQPTPGTFTVEFSHPLYESKTAEATLVNGEVTILDMQLGQLPSYQVSLALVDETTGNSIPNAQFSIQGTELTFNLTSGSDGLATGTIIEGEYQIYAGKWGYKNIGIGSTNINESLTNSYLTEPAYMDDYILDLGWSVTNLEEGNNFSGGWERAVPAGTYNSGLIFNPEADVEGDVGNMCYVTENEIGGSYFSSDVDNGTTILTSPLMDLTNYENPTVEFRTWFMTGGGDGNSDDDLEFYIDNGSTEILLLTYNTTSQEWSDKFSFVVSEFIEITSTMTVSMRTSDFASNGHVVEAGIDNFYVKGAPTVNIQEILAGEIEIYPTPASQNVTLVSKGASIKHIELINTLGQIVLAQAVNNNATVTIPVNTLPNGTYYVKIITSNDLEGTYPIQVIK